MSTILAPNQALYDLNRERALPGKREIDVAILPGMWPEFCTLKRVRLFEIPGYENELR